MKIPLRLFNKVGARLLVAFGLVALVPVLTVGWYAQNHSEQAMVGQTLQQHHQQVEAAANQLVRHLDGARQDVLFLARSFPMERYLSAMDSGDSKELDLARYALEREFLEFAESRGQFYYSLRYIDENGDEAIRINNQGQKNALVPRTKLKNEGKDNYFAATMKLAKGELYVSRLNLNREQGKVVTPHRPVLRYATPLFYGNGRRAGIVIANVSAGPLLAGLGDTILISDDGFYLNHPVPEKRWGAPRDLASGISFISEHGPWWDIMKQRGSDAVVREDDNFLTAYTQVKIPGTARVWWLLQESDTGQALASVDEFNKVFFGVTVVALILTMIIAMVAGRAITTPLNKLISVVKAVAGGDQNARAMIRDGGEFEDLGKAFDQMVDERIATMVKMEMENEALNNSIIELMEATAKLSENDLSIHVPVREDITGVVADGLNKMIKGTNEVLLRIQQVANEVREATQKVKERSDAVVEVAQEEREIVEETLRSLDSSAQAMQGVADLAQICSQTADQASGTTRKALETVTSTVSGMNEIREIISETEKRIKRLGERSQEINSVVEIINNIAERTHVLALNASMQAAAAGEAGRGFAVVADEVQRLAENSRNSTSQIAALVHNIQTETSETMATMNKSISQVVSGSELAELAGRQMKETEATTAELVQAVMKISDQAVAQSIAINELRRDAAGIRRSTQVTGQQLQEQAEQTDFLVDYSQSLQEAVQVFKLKAEG